MQVQNDMPCRLIGETSSTALTFDRCQCLKLLSAIPVALSTQTLTASNALDRESVVAPEQAQLLKLLSPDDLKILSAAAMAPSGHNTQPWAVDVLAPGHWLIGMESSRLLPAVDPHNREATLSIGAFLENLIVAAGQIGYQVDYQIIAQSSAASRLIDLKLTKAQPLEYPIARLKMRRTVRSRYTDQLLKAADIKFVTDGAEAFTYIARGTANADYLAEATIEANRQQTNRNLAQAELANWIRWSKAEQERYRNGLTPAGMEITGLAGWYVRNFYHRDSVMSKGFREKGIAQVIERVAQGGGWLVMSGASHVTALIETGRKFQRMWLKLRERGIAIHPMTQLLEEAASSEEVAKALGVPTPQFLLRIGYVKRYPEPVSPRMPVAWFTRAV
jgi:nitroreductase